MGKINNVNKSTSTKKENCNNDENDNYSITVIPDKFHDQCGVFGIVSKNADIAKLTYHGIYSLQHRGQESAGIAVSNGNSIHFHKGMGLVSNVFKHKYLKWLDNNAILSIGHVRYSTTGDSTPRNAQPLVVQYKGKRIAIVHNGNLTNSKELKNKLEENGSIFQTDVDTEVILHMLAKANADTIEHELVDILPQVKGAYSFIIMSPDKIIAVRDPNGFRPLCLGKIENDYCVASEDCALHQIDAEYIRDVNPGEMIVITEKGMHSRHIAKTSKTSMCIFELVYLARPDSTLFDKNVYQARLAMGKQLAQESSVDADIVVPVPDSGVVAALGFSKESNIPFEMGLLRNHYVGRTFIQPSQLLRISKVRIKLSPVVKLLKGKRIIIVDDSIVRGTTCREICRMLRKIGVKEIHLRISSPMIHYPCYFGIDTPKKDELIANNMKIDEMKEFFHVDSLHYLSKEGLLKSAGSSLKEDKFCTACFTGNYPIDL